MKILFLVPVLVAASMASPLDLEQHARLKRASFWDKFDDLVANVKESVEETAANMDINLEDIDLKKIGSDAEEFVSKIDFEGAADTVEQTATELWAKAVEGAKDIAESKKKYALHVYIAP